MDEKTIRSIISGWANSIEGHPYRDLGDQISIQSAENVTGHKTRVYTEIESRRADACSEPYSSQKLYSGALVELATVRNTIYDYNLAPQPAELDQSENAYTVTESTYKKDCTSCGATGRVNCHKCHGSGKETCSNCQGKGTVRYIEKCPYCHGKGGSYNSHQEIFYSTRDGQTVSEVKTVKDWNECRYCHGEGKIDHGDVKCTTCNGTGKVNCSSCYGNGKVKCQTCQGQKEMFHYIALNQKFHWRCHTHYFITMPSEDFEQMKRTLGDEDWTLENSWKNPSAEDMAKIFTNMRESILSRLSSEASQLKEDDKIVFQQAVIDSGVFVKVAYTINDKNYLLWISPTGKVFAAHSPISDYGDSLSEKAKKDIHRSRLYEARKKILGLAALNMAGQDYKEVLTGIENKMDNNAKFGSKVMFWILLVVTFGFNWWYLSEYSFCAPWIDVAGAQDRWIWKCLPVIYTIAAMIGARLLTARYRRFFAVRIPSWTLRFLSGMLMMTASAVAAHLALYILHFLILPAVWEIVGSIINGIFNLIFGTNWY